MTQRPELVAAMAALTRRNNLAIFLIVVTGLVSVALVETYHLFPTPPAYLWMLTLARIIAPIAAMVLTGVVTNRGVQRLLRASPDEQVPIEQTTQVLVAAKRFSIHVLGLTGVLAAGCLLIGHRTIDVILAVVPLLLLFVTRVNASSPLVFAAFVEARRREQAAAAALRAPR